GDVKNHDISRYPWRHESHGNIIGHHLHCDLCKRLAMRRIDLSWHHRRSQFVFKDQELTKGGAHVRISNSRVSSALNRLPRVETSRNQGGQYRVKGDGHANDLASGRSVSQVDYLHGGGEASAWNCGPRPRWH